MKILVTGGRGFVRTDLAACLLKDGHEATILIRSSEEMKGASFGSRLCKAIPHREGHGREVIRVSAPGHPRGTGKRHT